MFLDLYGLIQNIREIKPKKCIILLLHLIKNKGLLKLKFFQKLYED